MHHATSTTTRSASPTSTAHEARAESLAFAASQGLPSVIITGNTIPIRRLLWTWGGIYDRKYRQWSVPQHRAMEAQTIANRFTRTTPISAPVIDAGTPQQLSVPCAETEPAPSCPSTAVTASVESLSDVEVLALLIDGDPQASVSQHLRSAIDASGLRGLLATGPEMLATRLRCTSATALRIAAALDLPRRVWRSPHREAPTLSTPEAIAAYIGPRLAGLPHEELWCIPIGPTCHLVGEPQMITRGDVDGTDAGPRAVFRYALAAGATSCAVAHNHPSGCPTPSPADIGVTTRLVAAGRTVDLPLVDHLIIAGAGRFTSLRRDRPDCFR